VSLEKPLLRSLEEGLVFLLPLLVSSELEPDSQPGNKGIQNLIDYIIESIGLEDVVVDIAG